MTPRLSGRAARRPRPGDPPAASGQTLYLEAAAGITTAVLAGRYLEARARVRSGSALSVLAGVGAKTVAVRRDGTEQRVPVAELAAGTCSSSGRGRRSSPTGRWRKGPPRSTASLATGESMPSEVGPGDVPFILTFGNAGTVTIEATVTAPGTP